MQGTEAVDTLLTSLSTTLAAGSYFAQIGALAPHDQVSPAFDPAQYFNMGAYFLTGSGFAQVPEPGTTTLLIASVFLIARRRRAASSGLIRAIRISLGGADVGHPPRPLLSQNPDSRIGRILRAYN